MRLQPMKQGCSADFDYLASLEFHHHLASKTICKKDFHFGGLWFPPLFFSRCFSDWSKNREIEKSINREIPRTSRNREIEKCNKSFMSIESKIFQFEAKTSAWGDFPSAIANEKADRIDKVMAEHQQRRRAKYQHAHDHHFHDLFVQKTSILIKHLRKYSLVCYI